MQYDPRIDLRDDNRSHTLLIQLAGHHKNVLDVGCARGYIGQILTHQFNCTMSGVEIDSAAAAQATKSYREVITGNIEDTSIFEKLNHGPFDIIIFGDVLEHLRQPESVLSASRTLLNANGFALISLPNVVTLRLRLRFLRGRFEYTDQGIMDKTHLRFFTLRTAHELIQQAGYSVEQMHYVVGPNIGRRLAQFKIPRRWLPPTLFATQFIFKVYLSQAAR